MEFDLAVFIGRFQPFHTGHLHVAKEALKRSKRLLFLLGSSNLPRTTRNPFVVSERRAMIHAGMYDAGYQQVHDFLIYPIHDHPYDLQRWIRGVQQTVQDGVEDGKSKVALTGHNRDNSSFYLKKFPQWPFIAPDEGQIEINATEIRQAFFSNQWNEFDAPRKLTPSTLSILTRFREGREFQTLSKEFNDEAKYREQWGKGPFQTVDAVVVQSGHVLLVERGGEMGKGKLALPGGHLDLDETLDRAAIRELFEETCIFEDEADDEKRRQLVWQGYRARERFDDPNRSTRARVITEAFLFKLPDGPLPAVRGADDAKRAFWCPLSEVKVSNMFDDHYFIIEKMLRSL